MPIDSVALLAGITSMPMHRAFVGDSFGRKAFGTIRDTMKSILHLG
jgi:hypothetical protein